MENSEFQGEFQSDEVKIDRVEFIILRQDGTKPTSEEWWRGREFAYATLAEYLQEQNLPENTKPSLQEMEALIKAGRFDHPDYKFEVKIEQLTFNASCF